jgi:hypothetical protein
MPLKKNYYSWNGLPENAKQDATQKFQASEQKRCTDEDGRPRLLAPCQLNYTPVPTRLDSKKKKVRMVGNYLEAVLRIRIRMFLDLVDPDPSIIKQK